MISSDGEFQPLLIVICSFGKNQGGSPGYATRGSVIESLEAEDGRTLLDRRNKIFQIFEKGEILFDHSDEREHAYNKHFVCGPDQGGQTPLQLIFQQSNGITVDSTETLI